MAPIFSQPARVTPYRVSGVAFVPNGTTCLVLIDDAQLSIVRPAGTLVDRSPVSGVQLATPALPRRAASPAFLVVNGHKWAIDFYSAALTQRFRSGGLIMKISVFLGFQSLASARQARRTTREFVAALLSLGAVDRRKNASR